MGFLNHSTNNIIIDAVLTERGREVLSRNDGTFSIESFSFGDDEIDYGIIKKYGLISMLFSGFFGLIKLNRVVIAITIKISF